MRCKMGWITDWSYRKILMATGIFGGAILGSMGGGWFGASIGGLFGGLLTFAAMNIEPLDPTLGPHQ